MLPSQPKDNSHVTHVITPVENKVDVDKSNKKSDKVTKLTIFGLVVNISYNIITFIPRKTWAGIKLICNKIQQSVHDRQRSVHDRKIRARQAENAAYLEKARVAFPPKVPEFLLESSQLIKYNRGLVQADILQRANDFKGEGKGKNFSSRVLGSSPSSMKKSIAEADRKAAITDHAKREFQLRKQYGKLACELKELENAEKELGAELNLLSEKLLVMRMRVRESDTSLEYEEMMRIFEVRNRRMKVLKAERVSKEEVLADAHGAYNRHIGI